MRSNQSNSASTTGLKFSCVPPNHTRHLIKKYCKHNDPADDSKTSTEGSVSHNIFREDGEVIDRIGALQSNLRPVGGIELYKKMEKILKQSGLKKMSKRSNKQLSFLSVNTATNKHHTKRSQNQKLSFFNAQIRTIQQQIVQEKQPIPWKEELYKSHQTYSPSRKNTRCQQPRQTAPVLSNSSHSLLARPQTSTIDHSKQPCQLKDRRLSMLKWVAEQSKNYQDKMALLNQINYNRPLLQAYGNRYFEHTLRNRFEDELQTNCFVYQLDGQFSEGKVIDSIKSSFVSMQSRDLCQKTEVF